jgi:hypothetical protein
VLAWFKEHGTAEFAQFVYRSWLDAVAKLDKADTVAKVDEVEAHVLAWLKQHGTAEVARFVYESWLEAVTKLGKADTAVKVDKIEAHVLTWLKEHGTAEFARFVYAAWLNAGLSADQIRGSMVEWFNANPGHAESDYVIKAWLEATRDFASVRRFALLWLKSNTKNIDAVFVLKFIARDPNLPMDAVEDVLAWCANFPDNFDSICRIGPILSRFAEGTLERRLTVGALLVLEHVQTDWLTDQGVRVATLATIAALARKIPAVPDIESRLDSVHAPLFRRSPIYSIKYVSGTPSFALDPILVHYVASMIRRKVIDVDADRNAIEQFADWLAAWPVDRKKTLRSAVQELELAHPIPNVWARVGVTGSGPPSRVN